MFLDTAVIFVVRGFRVDTCRSPVLLREKTAVPPSRCAVYRVPRTVRVNSAGVFSFPRKFVNLGMICFMSPCHVNRTLPVRCGTGFVARSAWLAFRKGSSLRPAWHRVRTSVQPPKPSLHVVEEDGRARTRLKANQKKTSPTLAIQARGQRLPATNVRDASVPLPLRPREQTTRAPWRLAVERRSDFSVASPPSTG